MKPVELFAELKSRKDEIEKTGRNAIIPGFYTGSPCCDDSVPESNNIDNYIPIQFIALRLRDWILANYEEHVSIDIVAHSMGCINERGGVTKSRASTAACLLAGLALHTQPIRLQPRDTNLQWRMSSRQSREFVATGNAKCLQC